MTTHENLLSDETSRMERTIGSWVAVANATLSHVVRFSPYTRTLDSNVRGNSLKIVSTAIGDVEVATGQVAIVPKTFYKTFDWVHSTTASSAFSGTRYYSVDGTMLEDANTEFLPLSATGWNGIFHISVAPENASFVEAYVRFVGAESGDEMFISWPTIMQQSKITTDFVDYALYTVPDYILEADLSQTSNNIGAPTPFIRYTTIGSKQLSDVMDDVRSWDHVSGTFSESGTADYSSLSDPFKVRPEWLPWLAQLMGVSLDTVPSGGRSPWMSFETAGIDDWTDWEESIDVGSIPGVPDTEWVDIESYSPDYFDTDTARRLQIASGFNGVLGGTSESIMGYVGALLNTSESDPFVYVVKHYATNPYRILVSTLVTDDPDPYGDMLKLAIESATPAGTSVITKHGVSVTARTYYSIPEMISNLWDEIGRGGSLLPVRFVENSSANGRHIVLGNVDTSGEPFLGGGIGLARWYPGFAFYSGAIEVETGNASAYNILGDIDIRVLLSNLSTPTTGTVGIAGSPLRWSLSVDVSGSLVFSWENAGTSVATSTVPVDWGSGDKGPFWVRATLDVNNDASGHDVAFYTAPTLYEEVWDQVGATITTAGTSGIDSNAAATVTVLGNDVSPEDGASVVVYRVMVYDGIGGTIAADIDLTGDVYFADSLVNTGSTFFRIPITNIPVSVTQAASGTAGLTESVWTVQSHGGGDDYFYLGKSPYRYDSGNATGLGDALTAAGLPLDTYNWEIRTVNNELITGSTGATTTITWDSDSYGGESIVNIAVREASGSTVQGFFTAELLAGDLAVNSDIYGIDWSINRSWPTATSFYEYSAFVDRDHISPTLGAGTFDSGIVFDAEETITVAVSARRFWSDAEAQLIVDHVTTSGWSIGYNGEFIECKVTDGSTTVVLSYNEVSGGTFGSFSLVSLRRDVGAGEISMWINDAVVDSAADPFVGGGLFPVVGRTGVVGGVAGTRGFDLRYFGIFDRGLSESDIVFLSGEMARLAVLLPQAAKAVVPSLITSTVVVPNVGLEWHNSIVVLSVVDISPTVHSPGVGVLVLPTYVPTANVVYGPQVNMSVQAAAIASSHTVYGPQVNMSVQAAAIASSHTVYEPIDVTIV